MAEKLVPMTKGGRPVELAVTPRDFMRAKVVPKGTNEFETYADAGYHLTDRYEDLTEYDGPKTKAQFEKAAEERRAERAAPKAETVKSDAPAKEEAPKTEAKKTE